MGFIEFNFALLQIKNYYFAFKIHRLILFLDKKNNPVFNYSKMDQEIKSVAIELFYQMGIKKVKMDIIAQKLKISKRTIYEHFRNKETLIRKAIDLNQEEQNVIYRKILNESENIIEAVVKLLKYGSELLSNTNPLYFSDLQRLYPSIWNEKITQSKKYTCELILDLLKKGKQEGVYRQDINEEIIALILIEQLYMLTDGKHFHAGKFSIIEIYENIIISMTRGVATEKGLQLLENYRNPV